MQKVTHSAANSTERNEMEIGEMQKKWVRKTLIKNTKVVLFI